MTTQFPVTVVEASQAIGSFSLSEEFAAPAHVTTHNTSSTSTVSDDVAKMLDRLKNIEKVTGRAAMLTKQMTECPLPVPPMVVPPMVESDRASAKRRRRTRYTPLLGITENAVCLTPSAWPPTWRA